MEGGLQFYASTGAVTELGTRTVAVPSMEDLEEPSREHCVTQVTNAPASAPQYASLQPYSLLVVSFLTFCILRDAAAFVFLM